MWPHKVVLYKYHHPRILPIPHSGNPVRQAGAPPASRRTRGAIEWRRSNLLPRPGFDIPRRHAVTMMCSSPLNGPCIAFALPALCGAPPIDFRKASPDMSNIERKRRASSRTPPLCPNDRSSLPDCYFVRRHTRISSVSVPFHLRTGSSHRLLFPPALSSIRHRLLLHLAAVRDAGSVQ